MKPMHSSWLNSETSYSNHNFPMTFIFLFYVWFSKNRRFDLGQRRSNAKDFSSGTTAGRSIYGGKPHQDGQSQ